MRTPSNLFLCLVFCFASSCAQRPATPAFGSVSGAVTCVDTNLPARLTSITLVPVPGPPVAGEKEAPKDGPPSLTVHRTRLDGTFQMSQVKPGRYYVVVEKPGYLSPVSQFTDAEVDHPTPELKEALAKAIPMVTVAANSNSVINLSLVRAASVTGIIRFDDGTYAPEMMVSFERRNKEGKYVEASLPGPTPSSDDQGHFHASGLPAGKYRMKTHLFVPNLQVSGVFGGSHSMVMSNSQGIVIYYGDVFRGGEAKEFALEDGQDFSADITVPVAKIHSISGSLAEARTGHAINAGTVQLFAGDEEIASAKVDPDDSTFHFDFVPEGEYEVRVSDAREVSREEMPLPPGSFGTRRFHETVLQSYAAYKAPFVVQGDQTGVVLPIPAGKPGQTAPAASNRE
jgi:hypothetical protein